MTTTLRHLAGRVWLYPHDPDPANVQAAVAVIADERGSVVVDAGFSPALARTIQQDLRALGLPPPRWLVYTHHHWDHVWGACAWEGVEVIGHESGVPLLEAERRRPWSHEYLREQVVADPSLGPSFEARGRAMANWGGFEVVVPQRTFVRSLILPTGVEIRHVGGGHAPDSSVVVDPESSVLLLGDSYYPPPFHLRRPGDGVDVELARGFVAEGHEWYVESHADPATAAEASTMLAELEA